MRKDGKLVWLSTSGFPILDDKGELLGYRGANTNITELKESEERFRIIFDNKADLSSEEEDVLDDIHQKYIASGRNNVIFYRTHQLFCSPRSFNFITLEQLNSSKNSSPDYVQHAQAAL